MRCDWYGMEKDCINCGAADDECEEREDFVLYEEDEGPNGFGEII